MLKSTLNRSNHSLSSAQIKLDDLCKKEKKSYDALAALINFLSPPKKSNLTARNTFSAFKKATDAAAAALELKHKNKRSSTEPKFNVKHYEHAIVCASDSSYRDMAIQAASKDLNQDAMYELVISLRRNCRDITRQIKQASAELRRSEKIIQEDDDTAAVFV